MIIGGGVSGTLTAYHLLRSEVKAKVILIDPSPRLGLGLAYSTPSYQHLLNVPAGKISALPEQLDHFLHWVQKNYDARATGSDFIPRIIFGRYIQSLLSSVQLDHRRATVLDCRVSEDRATVLLSDGSKIVADAVVLATGNFNPAVLPGVAEQAIVDGVYYHSAWKDATYARLAPDATVALIGSGLTAVDVLLRLRENGHRGPVLAISRHGVFPQRHARYEPLQEPVISGPPPARALDLLRAVHRAIRGGQDWRAVVDSLRGRTNELWKALPLVEQRRFQRHLQRRWEVVRHRMAPSIADKIDAELEAGTLIKIRGSLHAVLSDGDGAQLRLRTGDEELKEVHAARVINCTGPNINYHRVGSSLFHSLFAQGAMVAGPLGAGMWTDERGALRDRDGRFSDILFDVGPGRLGTILESIGVMELRGQAAEMAELLIQRFGAEQTGAVPEAEDSVSTLEARANYELAT